MTMSTMMEQLLQQLTQVTPTSVWEWFLGDPLMVVSTILAAVILRWVLNRSIARIVDVTIAKHDARRERVPGRAGRVLAQATGLDHERHRQRTLTMGSLLHSIVTFAVTLVTVLTVMAIVGIPLGPLLASAGVGGVALGFGAQSLVKDFLSGIFMILEDQYGVGDVIDTGEAIGTVEEVTLRVTRLRDANGVVWYVRNGEIVRIGNKSQGWSTAIVDIPVSYAENVERVIPRHPRRRPSHGRRRRSGRSTSSRSRRWSASSRSTGTAMTMRIIAKTAAEEQFGVSREMRERVKAAFDEAGIKGPPIAPFAPTAAEPPAAGERPPVSRGPGLGGPGPRFERLPL